MDDLLRNICRLLIVTLATVFGFGVGALGVYFGLVVAFGSLGRDDWGAAPIWLLAMAIGALVGAVFMLVSSFGWSLDVHFRAFNKIEWLGVVLGALAGGLVYGLLPERYYFWFRCVIMAALMPTCVLIACLAMKGLAAGFRARKD